MNPDKFIKVGPDNQGSRGQYLGRFKFNLDYFIPQNYLEDLYFNDELKTNFEKVGWGVFDLPLENIKKRIDNIESKDCELGNELRVLREMIKSDYASLCDKVASHKNLFHEMNLFQRSRFIELDAEPVAVLPSLIHDLNGINNDIGFAKIVQEKNNYSGVKRCIELISKLADDIQKYSISVNKELEILISNDGN
jgi:hypothetical protein